MATVAALLAGCDGIVSGSQTVTPQPAAATDPCATALVARSAQADGARFAQADGSSSCPPADPAVPTPAPAPAPGPSPLPAPNSPAPAPAPAPGPTGPSPAPQLPAPGPAPTPAPMDPAPAPAPAPDPAPAPAPSPAAVAPKHPPRSFAAYTGEDAKVTLKWQAPLAGGDPVTGYKIFRATTANVATNGTPHATVNSGTTYTYQDTAVANGTKYFYRIAAANSGGSAVSADEPSARPWAPGAAASQDQLFVDDSAAPGGDGSRATPFQTIADAVAAAKIDVTAGATIVVLDGTYAQSTGTSLEEALTIRSASGHHLWSDAVLTGTAPSTVAASGLVLKAGAAGTTILGLEFKDFAFVSDNDGCIYGQVGTSDLTISRNHFHDNIGAAVGYATSPGDSTNVTITQNLVEDVLSGPSADAFKMNRITGFTFADNVIDTTRYGGFQLDRVYNGTIARNTISNTPYSGIALGGSGFSGITIEDNVITDTNLHTVVGTNVNHGGIRIKENGTGNLTIRRNVVTGSRNGLRFVSALNVTALTLLVEDNVLASNPAFGLNHTGTGTVDARDNYWGVATGPFHTVSNPAGGGNAVSDNVLYDPYLTQDPR